MIPDGWQLLSLDSITKIDKPIVYGIVQAGIHISDGVPYIKSSDVGKSIDIDSLQRTSESIAQKYKRSEVKPGDIVFSLRGNIGESSIVPINLARANLTQGTARISVNINHSNKFVKYALSSGYIIKKIGMAAKGSTFQEISLHELRKLEILLPPFLEQCRIAEVLGVWDESIDLLERLIGRVRSRKQGLMQQLLTGKKRFKEFEGSEWKKVKIRKLMVESRIHGLTGLDAKKITVKLYCKGVFAKEEKRVGSENTNYFKRKSGQFIYSKLDFLNGAFGIVPDKLDGYESTLDLPCFDFTEYAIPKFIFYFVGREEFYSRFADQAIGGRKARRVSPEEFLSTEIKIPSLPEQEKIAAVLSAADEEISTLDKQLAAYKQQKLGLMQQLLTGRIRI